MWSAFSDAFSRLGTGRGKSGPERQDETDLADFAPVGERFDNDSFKRFFMATQAPLADIAAQQADALQPVWEALADDLNVDCPNRIARFTAGDLKDIFLSHSRHMKVVQMQVPGIVPAHMEVSVRKAVRKADHIPYAEMSGVFEDETMFTRDVQHQFSLMSVVREQGDGRTLIGVPMVGLEDWILRAFVMAGQMDALSALQNTVGRVAHDYYHHMIMADDPVYFTSNLIDPASVIPADIRKKFLHISGNMDRKWEAAIWPVLKSLENNLVEGGSMEPHVFLTHKRVFDRMWAGNEDFRFSALQDLDIFMDGVFQVQSLEKRGTHFAYAALSIMGSYILRAADADHEMMSHFVEGIDARFNFSRMNVSSMMGDQIADGELDDVHTAGELVLWNADRVAGESYAVIHDEDLQGLTGLSRQRAQHEMDRARRGLAAWTAFPA